MNNLHHHRILHEVRHMINNQQFTNMDIVCSNGVLKQNRAVIQLALPFLECYGNIFENKEDLLIMLPDFSHEEILLKIQEYFFNYVNSEFQEINEETSLARMTSNIHWVGQDTSKVNSIGIQFQQTAQNYFITENNCLPQGHENHNSLTLGYENQKSVDCVKCDVCGQVLRKCSLSGHMRLHQQRDITCVVCKKQFVRKTELIIHQRTHTGETPYQCNMCEKAFSTIQGLKAHFNTHGGKKLFTCDVCDKSFYTSSKLKLHMLVHSGDKQFECPQCGIKFTRQDNMKAHINKVYKAG
eukprot:GFUD01051613.1.p1 GENE.GFUD01051613.1~~GFUD01051613.1.p1  ORF type:complete len:297 (+),score=64.23 GFUD01051613.1:1417-2307(+)